MTNIENKIILFGDKPNNLSIFLTLNKISPDKMIKNIFILTNV